MIISPQHRFIFAAIPKTGTHAVRQALREHMGPQDLEQVGLFVNRKLILRSRSAGARMDRAAAAYAPLGQLQLASTPLVTLPE